MLLTATVSTYSGWGHACVSSAININSNLGSLPNTNSTQYSTIPTIPVQLQIALNPPYLFLSSINQIQTTYFHFSNSLLSSLEPFLDHNDPSAHPDPLSATLLAPHIRFLSCPPFSFLRARIFSDRFGYLCTLSLSLCRKPSQAFISSERNERQKYKDCLLALNSDGY